MQIYIYQQIVKLIQRDGSETQSAGFRFLAVFWKKLEYLESVVCRAFSLIK